VDITDKAALSQVFAMYNINSVIHFAGLKSVSESVAMPLSYYSVNVNGTCTLLECMKENNVHHIVFSSSATVYGHPKTMPIFEDHELGPINPYGRSKYVAELVIQDFCAANPSCNAALLRYFNPIGAHASGLIGEDPNGIPNNLLPYITQVLSGKLQQLSVFGNDYETRDGTGVRDFVHVVDLAKGHLAALKHLVASNPSCVIFNMGTGTGSSVLEIVKTMETESGLTVPFVFKGRRVGDAAEVVADPSKALKVLGWKCELGLNEMCGSAWNWQRSNPDGYPKEKETETAAREE
jgi:UDP-glucose 4-epimerase